MMDLTGLKFNKLTVLKMYGRNKHKKITWVCKCDCGNEKVIVGSDLKSGNSKSCGCHNLYVSKINHTTHNMSNTKLYYNYNTIKNRCYNANFHKYKSYGARGIKMCDDWVKSFLNFYTWAMSNGYKEGLTIERINVNGDYEPSNCKFISKTEQCHNKQNTIKITYNNETKLLHEWAKLFKIKTPTLYTRLHVYKWSIEKSLSTPVRKLKCRDYPERE